MGFVMETSPLHFRDFRLFWIARFSAVIATMAMIVIIGWQSYDLARTEYGLSPALASGVVSLLGLAQFTPLFILTPIAGWVADRFDRRHVAICANGVDFGVALALAWLTASHRLDLPFLFILAACHGVARVFVGPAMSSMVANVVPTDVLPRAIAMNAMSWQAGTIIGPALGGWLYGADPQIPYWMAAAMLILATLALAFMKPVRSESIKGTAHPVRQMIEGLQYVWKDHLLLGAITLDLFAVLLGGATALLPAFARDILHIGPSGLGWLRAAPAVGATAIALLFSVKPLKTNVGIKMLWAVAMFGAGTVGFGLSKAFGLSFLMLAIIGGADMFSVFVRGALVQLNTPDQMRGRVSSFSGLAISASNELGEIQSGLAAVLLGGPVGAVVFGGVGAILVAGLWARLFPELRNARTFETQRKDAPQ